MAAFDKSGVKPRPAMLRERMRPLLLLDIDGVISLFGFPPDDRPDGTFHSVEGIPHLISADAGAEVNRLRGAFELVWCSGWEEKANDHLPAALGLPGRLPHLSFDRAVGRANTHWKLGAIDAYAGPDRPLAWVDDALDDRCEAWAAARPGPTLLVRTDPAVGLRAAHSARLLAWAAGYSRPSD